VPILAHFEPGGFVKKVDANVGYDQVWTNVEAAL
jgi:hypothetical protein